jgi:hypothetical protein
MNFNFEYKNMYVNSLGSIGRINENYRLGLIENIHLLNKFIQKLSVLFLLLKTNYACLGGAIKNPTLKSKAYRM